MNKENETMSPEESAMLPVLRYVAAVDNPQADEEKKESARRHAEEAVHSMPEVYRGIVRAWDAGDEEAKEAGTAVAVRCNRALLAHAMDYCRILLHSEQEQRERNAYNAALHGQGGQNGNAGMGSTGGREMLFIAQFRITDEGEAVDLTYPFEQYYFCDAVMYPDFEYRRIELADKCKAWLRHYRPYYVRIEAAYRDECERGYGFSLPTEYVTYMELIDFFFKQIAYEDSLREQREKLQYEAGGLGWFRLKRKKEVRRALLHLDYCEVKLRADAVREACLAYEAQFEKKRHDWTEELENAPRTAFARRRELKAGLQDIQQKIAAFRVQSRLSELERECKRLSKFS